MRDDTSYFSQFIMNKIVPNLFITCGSLKGSLSYSKISKNCSYVHLRGPNLTHLKISKPQRIQHYKTLIM